MKKILFSLILTSIVMLNACHNHNETGDYIVAIAINKPTDNQTVTKNTALPIEVVVTRADNQTVHNVKVEILDSKGATVETLIDKHYHASGKATYTEGGYKPTATGSFKLRVTSTDDDKLQPNTKEVSFTVN
jgi:hypothetical protein